MLQDGSNAIVVDRGEAQPVFDALARNKLQLAAILVTHHRPDHAHKYTLANPRFARSVKPDNADLTHYTARCEIMRAQGQPTLPSQLAPERQINPFLRSREATVLRAVREHAELSADAAEADVFAALRQWKNDFR